MQQNQHLLRLAERKNRNQHTATAPQSLANHRRQSQRLLLPRILRIARRIPTRRFQDERVHPSAREIRRRSNRLLLEIHIPTVQNRSHRRVKLHPDRP